MKHTFWLPSLLLVACSSPSQAPDPGAPDVRPAAQAPVSEVETKALQAPPLVAQKKVTPAPVAQEPPPPVAPSTMFDQYPWLRLSYRDADTSLRVLPLDQAIAVPEGFARVKVSENSYQAYLRGLPVRAERKEVLMYTGEPVRMPSAGVIPLDLGRRDLHQCADSVIRLHAEYLWSQGRAADAAYHYTSGDLAAWKDWRKGRPLRVKGSKVYHAKGTPAANTHKAFRRYLDRVFMYASTRSLHRDSVRVTSGADLRAGDFLLQGGSPGHVVMLLDVAEHPDGRRVALLGQGYLPAREFHVISGTTSEVLAGAWYVLPKSTKGAVRTPTWAPFTMRHAWRFK